MSAWIELAGFLAGTLSGYAEKNRWSKGKMFIAMTCSVSALFATCFALTPSSKSIWVCMAIAGITGFGMGLFSVLLMWLTEWHKSRKTAGRKGADES